MGTVTTSTLGDQALASRLTALIRDVPDYPKPGIVFKDITPLLLDPAALDAAAVLTSRVGCPVSGVVADKKFSLV